MTLFQANVIQITSSVSSQFAEHCKVTDIPAEMKLNLTLGGHLTEGSICGIKVVVAVLVVEPDHAHAAMEPHSKSLDLFLDKTGLSPLTEGQ